MNLYHLTIAVRGRRAVARDEAGRRRLVLALVRVGGSRLMVFCLVDDHLHVGLRAQRPARTADSLHRVLRAARPELTFKAPHLEPVDTRPYLRWLIRYVLRQPIEHGLGREAATWTGSCFQDLVGMRSLPGFDCSVLRSELPRLRLRDLYADLDLVPSPPRLATDAELTRAGPVRLAELATTVLAVGPTLSKLSPRDVASRSLAAHAAAAAGFRPFLLAPHLGVSPRSMRRAAARPVDVRALRALRRRLAFLEDVRRLRKAS
jgi:hypothetical protein